MVQSQNTNQAPKIMMMDTVDSAAAGGNSPHRSTHPPFPEPGSVVGPDDAYFCLGRLGKGTFCAIHKCVDLSFAHSHSLKTRKRKNRIVAAKVELANFVDSGVIDGEASVLRFLDSALPTGMVPTFVDYVRHHGTSSLVDTTNNNIAIAPPPPIMSSSSVAGMVATPMTPGAPSLGGGGGGTSDGGLSAIIMECLPGEDMHLLRDRHCQEALGGADGSGTTLSLLGGRIPRRLSVEDAVYLVADVMLPLLKAMHDVGIVHRDVKPSNVVRTGTTPSDRKFKIVDFGLSKCFVVPETSSLADKDRPWKGKWMDRTAQGTVVDGSKDNNDDEVMTTTTMATVGGCIRLERDSAEFRGTSMYASLRVHQGKDHCPRDDIWGLLYVFCDLVSGGLPWMGYASARDRTSCQILKEMVMGERGRDDWTGDGENPTEGKKVEGMASKPDQDKVPKDGGDAIEWLLYGAEFHNAKYRRDMKSQDVNSLPPLPEPLALSKNIHYINCLRKAFRHVASLGFVEMPDYDLIDECLRGFLRDKVDTDDNVPSIDWKDRPASSKRKVPIRNTKPALDTGGVGWTLLDEDADPLDDTTLVDSEIDRRVALEVAAALEDNTSRSIVDVSAPVLDLGASLTGEAADLARLPLQLQFRLSQVEYNARHPTTIQPHVALRDWMALAIPLAHGTWDTATWERGNHRTDDDGFRNEVYMSMLQKCLAAADPFNRFSDRECYYHPLGDGETMVKRRRVGTMCAITQLVSDDSAAAGGGADDNVVMESPLVVVSRVFFSLRLALDLERGKNFAPPPKLSFGFNRA